MQFVCDLEIHSKYARACSKNSDLPHHELWARKKGIDIVGTGDFTHPAWFKECKEQLDEAGGGLYRLKPQYAINVQTAKKEVPFFIYTGEIACIFSRGGKVRRIHVLVFAPSREKAKSFSDALAKRGAKLAADGRPIIGMDMIEVAKIAQDIDPQFLVIPAHVWTPWFGMYGSKSGFDTFAEAWGDIADWIPGIETGLSSDPSMNWRLSELDSKSIISFSDAHSPTNLGREVTVIEMPRPAYTGIANAIRREAGSAIIETWEFYPEEGMYHFDGHRACKVRWSPHETKKHEGRCPVCGRMVTKGVLYRVEELARREEGYRGKDKIPYRHLIPLPEIIADFLEVGKKSKVVEKQYEQIVQRHASEFEVLLHHSYEILKSFLNPYIVEGIRRMRKGDVRVEAGYDGVYGKVSIFTEQERRKMRQEPLFTLGLGK